MILGAWRPPSPGLLLEDLDGVAVLKKGVMFST